jgi:hypothetical protein
MTALCVALITVVYLDIIAIIHRLGHTFKAQIIISINPVTVVSIIVNRSNMILNQRTALRKGSNGKTSKLEISIDRNETTGGIALIAILLPALMIHRDFAWQIN